MNCIMTMYQMRRQKTLGKGSKQRPRATTKKQFEENWDKIFGKKSNKKRDSVEVENE